MIYSRVTAKAQTTIPRAVRAALALEPGDDVSYEIDGGKVILRRVDKAMDPFENPFALSTEGASEADCKAYDNL
ncbi:AbrB/MazE/SpoVT family DNA-binding domain-containing protein [Sphingomonas sp.]|jgi:antitoxin PrlF|uniref:AbrB/MazE/SpoVT family DNA-binding domain-containing protein n=1 Tax=Sphingomonas sp. TaxID=28214 RepID=UPI002D7E6B1C|nr:type II toxin-antitoxin system PrlF family antitoxin [Sphingomonas sp.]HEU0045447.1 type II toxin-antitoxin system PrlF family antitoxin [Sphingomonas sp.]